MSQVRMRGPQRWLRDRLQAAAAGDAHAQISTKPLSVVYSLLPVNILRGFYFEIIKPKGPRPKAPLWFNISVPLSA
jgi:hypothetical protein